MKDRAAKPKSNKNPEKKKKIISFSVLILGITVLVVGVVFLVLNIMKANKAADGDYLVTAGNWTLDGQEGVIWDFTEIGKGKLTTNNHINDYDFIWSLEDNKLKIETDWLYNLNNEYEYTLDQGAKTLTLTSGEDVYRFMAE